jgi:hypothetical protein
LRELESIGWLSTEQRAVLTDSMSRLRDNRMLGVLLPDAPEVNVDTARAARIFRERLGDPDPSEAPAVGCRRIRLQLSTAANAREYAL